MAVFSTCFGTGFLSKLSNQTSVYVCVCVFRQKSPGGLGGVSFTFGTQQVIHSLHFGASEGALRFYCS